MLATTGITYFCSISLAQITILRCLYINNWGRMVMVDDDFIARICYQFNILICTMFTIIKADLEQYHGNYHYHAARNLFGLQGGPFDQKTYKRISFWWTLVVFKYFLNNLVLLLISRFIGFPIMFLVLVIGICLSIIGFQKLKNKWVLKRFAEKNTKLMKYYNNTHNPQVIKEKGKTKWIWLNPKIA